MKKALKLFLLSALAVTALSCTHKDLEYRHKSVSPTFTAGVSTKADGALWTKDQIGINVISSPNGNMSTDYVNVPYTTDADGIKEATFTADGTAIEFDTDETVTFIAYAPYYATTSIATLPGADSDGVISENTESQSTSARQTALDFLYADEAYGSEDSPNVVFTFSHVMTQLTINIVAGEGVSADAVAAGSYVLNGIVHDGAFDVNPDDADLGTAYLTGTEADTDWDLTTNWYAVEGSSYDASYSCLVFPQTPTTLALSATIGSLSVDAIDLLSWLDDGVFLAGNSYVYTITVTNTGMTVSGSTINDWFDHDYDITVGGGTDTDEEVSETLVYGNDFDAEVVTSNTTIKSTTTCYQNETGSGISTVTYDYSSNMSIRTSAASGATYEGASGNNNVFFGTDDPDYFTIQNITLPDGETNYTLTFGTIEYGVAWSGDNFKVYLSQDGEKWVKLAYSFVGDEPTSSAWGLASSSFTVPDGTTTLYIYFEGDVTSKYHLDDVVLNYTETAGTEIDFSTGVSVPEKGDPDDVETTGDGTETNPYTIADVYALFEANATDATTSVYVTGKVSQIGELTESYGELDYYLSDDGETENELYIYEGLGLNGDKITSTDYLSVGDVVVVYGALKNYNDTYEMNYGSKIISINGSSEGSGNEGGDDDDDSGSTGETNEAYVTNVTWSGTSDTHCEPSDVINIDGVSYSNVLKIGTAKEVGSGTCTLPVGATSFSFYCLSWSSTPCKVTVGETTYEFTADGSPAVSGNSPYSVSAADLDESDFGSFTFDALTEETTLTFETTGSGYRVVVFGAKYAPEESSAD